MSQTLLALAAILVFSLFALGQHRAQAGAERTEMGGEIELAATTLARSTLVEATGLAFDEALAGSERFEVDPDELTLPADFGVAGDDGETATTPADDVDDLHGVTNTVSVQRNGQAGQTTQFTVTYTVRYVRDDAPGTAAGPNERTLAKEVAVTVQEVTPAQTGRPPVRCTLTQVVTPVWRLMHG